MADKIYKVRDPSGAIREIKGPEGASDEEIVSQAKKLFSPAEPKLSAGDISAHARKAAVSNWRGENPTKAKVSDFLSGASTVFRGGANLVSDGLGDKLWPDETSADTGYKLAGQIADPAAWAIGGGVGKVLPYAPVIGKGIVQGGKALLTNALSGGVTGGLIGGLASEGDLSATASSAGIGAAVNTVLPPVVGGVARGLSAAKNAVYPSPGTIAVKAAGDKSGDVINALTASRSAVPGVNMTVGEASVPANSAEFAALQKLVSSKDPSRYFGTAGIKGQQEAARSSAIGQIAGTDSQRSMAEAVRDYMSSGFYARARQEGIDPAVAEAMKPQIDNLLERMPKSVVEKARELARIKGEAIGQEGSVSGLHYIKKAIDDLIDGAPQTGMGKQTKHALLTLKGDLLKTLEELSPNYMTGNRNFQTFSAPINQQQVGAELLKKLESPLGTTERASGFAGAVKDAPRTTKNAIGFEHERLGDVLTSPQEKVVNEVLGQLQNDVKYKSLASAGTKNLENRIGVSTVPPTGMFQPMISAARSWVNTALGTGHERALERLAPLMASDPQAFAKIIQAATPQQKAVIESIIAKYGARPAMIGGANSQAQTYTGGH